MLSFDITDRSIKIISGHENGGKIKINQSASIDLVEGIIENGMVRDVPNLASKINEALKANKMSDKIAVISISSNSIIFKEMHVLKAKSAQFKTMVQNQFMQMINVSEEHAVSFTVVGDDDAEPGKERTTKVLATSCQRSIVNSFKKVFAMLGIALKDVEVSCNCINKIVMSDKYMMSRMPFLLVQIDPTFININIYEDGQLSFSRFASISPDNYDDREDYVFHAVNENIFRILQFQRSRSDHQITNVVFYGDTSLYIRLTNSLEEIGLTASLLRVSDNISGYERLEFALYANAIGAMFKNKKEGDSTNLLDVDVGTTKQVQV